MHFEHEIHEYNLLKLIKTTSLKWPNGEESALNLQNSLGPV